MATTSILVAVTAFVLLPATWLSLTATIPVNHGQNFNLTDLYLEPDETNCGKDDLEYVSPIDNSNPRCCTKCGPGRGMVRLCEMNNDTICANCDVGQEFSSVSSALDKCQRCTQCDILDKRAKFYQSCTPTQDAVCECIPGYYFKLNELQCKSCSKCPKGEGVKEHCSRNEDTVCQKCGPGYFSDRIAAKLKCWKCSTCPSGSTEVQKCSATQNRLCCTKPPCDLEKLRKEDQRNRSDASLPPASSNGDFNWKSVILSEGQKSPNGSSSDEIQQPPHKKSNSVTSNDLIPLYCAIMSLVIITLVLYVAFKWWRRRNASGASKGAASAGALLGGAPGPVSVFSSGKRKNDTAADVEGRVGLINFSKEGSPCVLMATSNSPSHGTKKISELSAKRMRQIEAQLSHEKNGNGWAALAKALDYSPSELSNFESQADLQREPPVRLLLRDYSEQSCATVAHMTKALQKCGRTDVIPLLKEHSQRLTSTEPNQHLEMGNV